jgi:hypothetical protein
MMSDPPATFAVCRHHAGWMKMFRLFVWSDGATGQMEFLEAVDELRLWEPHAGMARGIYDRYIRGERDGGRKQIAVSGPLGAALADAFAPVPPPDRAAVFAAAYREVMDTISEGRYRDFLQMAQAIRAGLAAGDDQRALVGLECA